MKFNSFYQKGMNYLIDHNIDGDQSFARTDIKV